MDLNNPNTFEGIPSLKDETGLQNQLEQDVLSQLGIVQQPAEVPGTPNIGATPAPAPAPAPTPLQQPAQPQTFTEEQVKQLLQRYSQTVQSQMDPEAVKRAQVNQAINTEAARQGISREQVIEQLRARAQQAQNNPVLEKVNNLEARLQQMQQQEEAANFEKGLRGFGNRLGLSEEDLVYFGTKAYETGINLLYVKDYESVFRGLFPEQYALRIRRASSPVAPQVYGGSAVGNTNIDNTRIEDQYVDSFLKQSMPNYKK
jgi:hypothetical protein